MSLPPGNGIEWKDPTPSRISEAVSIASETKVYASGVKRQKLSVHREKKAAIISCIIVVSFTVCWFPFFLAHLCISLTDNFCGIPVDFSVLFLWLAIVNSAINPLIYTVFNEDFRRAFRNIILKY